MRLQTLEIKGFKSFAKDTVVHFNENVTGVVGPNGAGKSNIIDAIRWVLGEQKSKELRLEKMQDVIFNGTKKRKRSNAAQVSISFENSKGILPSEYNIVKISRTLFRSGESEYRLNDVPCRLKDIKNLLVDTGIGSNSYAIIELGMVDDILQDKDAARRKMFEQAAGISKYKTRKKEALSKLNLTQNDLDRVEDLLFEIGGNLKSLEKQARRAKRFLDLKEKYKSSSLLFYAVKINALKDAYLLQEQEVNNKQVQYHELRAQIDSKEAKLEKEKLKNINDEKQLSLFQQKISSLTDNIRKSESRKALLEKEISFSAEKVSGMEHRIKLLSEKLDELITQLQSNTQDIQKEQSVLKTYTDDFNDTSSIYNKLRTDYESKKSQIELKQQEKIELDKEQLRLDKEIAICANKIQQAEHTINYLKEHALELKIKEDQEAVQLVAVQAELDQLQIKMNELQQSDDQRLQRLQDIAQQADKLQQSKRNTQRKRDVKQNEIDLLQSMIKKLEGFPESIKYLAKHWNKEQILLSDIISCSDEHRPMVQLVMGDYLDYFVVDTAADALEAIALLKKNQRGRARFFALDRLPDLDSKKHDSFNPLKSVLEYDAKYEKLMSYLLHDTFILEAEKNNTIDQHPYLSLVSNDGVFMSKQAQLIGGSQSVFEAKKIGRKKKLKTLKVQHSEIEQELSLIEKQIRDLDAERQRIKQQDFTQAIRQSKQAIDQKTQQKFKLQASNDSLKNQREQHDENVAVQGKQISQNQERLTSFKKEAKQVEEQMAILLPALETSGQLNDLTEQLSASSKAMNEAQIAMLQQQNRLKTLEQEQKYMSDKKQEHSSEIAAIKNAVQREIDRQSKRETELKEVKELLQQAYATRQTEQADLGGIESSYFEAKHRISEAESTLKELNKSFTTLQSDINSLKDKISDVKFNIQGIKQRIQIEFSENINTFEYEMPADFSLDKQEIDIEKLKHRLASFGDINPMAVEAYNEMEERKTNIELQRDDILNAKEDLIRTMEEIESTATRLFLDAFDQVRKHFVTVFRSLFTQDDDCDLILLDPENPLKSGIEIIAKPKGKRPQSLSQLSGGEKTLTASALLFSLYLLKPAPFCIFDEVDAPLDDQNVQKFTNIIRAFSADSQFIVVTHNKATMAELDVLYGVFMEEKGVSSVSQVDFRNYEHKPMVAEAVG